VLDNENKTVYKSKLMVKRVQNKAIEPPVVEESNICKKCIWWIRHIYEGKGPNVKGGCLQRIAEELETLPTQTCVTGKFEPTKAYRTERVSGKTKD
jgi:hypothetical protein